MAHSKATLFKIEEQSLSLYCKVLSHPARQRIIELLEVRSNLTFAQVCEELPLTRASVQDHIIRLQRIGLIAIGRGPTGLMGYQLQQEAYLEMLELLSDFLRKRVA